MNVTTLKKALMAGVAGTVVMTVFTFLTNTFHFPATDFHGMIATHAHSGALFTWLIYFGMGVAFAYLYGMFFMKKLPYHSYMKGMIYALILWGAMHFVVMPVFGMGFLGGSIVAAVMAYVSLALYGATVGYLYES